MSDEENRDDYDLKTHEAVRALSEFVPDPQGQTLLDAGCGVGLFSRAFAKEGFSVTGVDFSPTAIEKASQEIGGEFLTGDLAKLDLGRRFDVVACLDVLFHLTDDDAWAGALDSLSSHVAPNGVLFIQEHLRKEPTRPEEHVRHRTLDMYVEKLKECGFGVAKHVTYDMRTGHKDLLMCQPMGQS